LPASWRYRSQTGILIGIGETRAERLESLLAIRDLHAQHGHIQEVIVQNFRAKPNTKRADAPEPDLDDLLWSIAAARLILQDDVHVQAPPNLSPGVYAKLIDAGIDDWGGVSPVTPDHVNPEAPWPEIETLARRTAEKDKVLVPRLPVYPSYAFEPDRWCAPDIAKRVRRSIDAEGWAREDDWAPGITEAAARRRVLCASIRIVRMRRTATAATARAAEIVRLFAARDADYRHCHRAADAAAPGGQRRRRALRRQPQHQLHQHLLLPLPFCAFSKGKTHEDLRGQPTTALERCRAAPSRRGSAAPPRCACRAASIPTTPARPICDLRGDQASAAGMHIHAFSPLEVTQGAATLGSPSTIPAA
jgi:FO synthase